MLNKIKSLISSEDGFEVREGAEKLQIGLPCSPLSLIFEKTPGGDVFMAFHCSASRIFHGDRTDLHDVCSWLVAAVFRRMGACSATLIDIEHPASGIPAELYGRYLVPEQSQGYLIAQDDVGLATAADMVTHFTLFEHLAHTQTTFWHPEPTSLADDSYDIGWVESREWAQALAKRIGERASPEDIHSQRLSTSWLYYRTTDGSVAVLESEELVNILTPMRAEPAEEVEGINGFLYTGKDFHNFVPRDALEIADRIFEQNGALARSDSPAASTTIVPLEDGVILAKNHRATLLRYDTGVSGFTRERDLVLERNRLEQERLLPPSEFNWADEVDGGRFERLIYDLLEREPGVREVRAVGAPHERDGGRDLIACWVTPPTPGEVLTEGGTPARERRVIIQCKARKRSVGRSDLGGGILDTLFMYHAEGYFLAASSQPAASTIDLLDEIGRRGNYFTGWWGRTEIEQRLRRNPQILRRYTDIVHPVE